MGKYVDALDQIYFNYCFRRAEGDPRLSEEEFIQANHYYSALEDAFELGDYRMVIWLMQRGCTIPPPMLPLIAELLINNSQVQLEKGRRKAFPRFMRLMIFLEMKLAIRRGDSPSKVCEQFASKYGNENGEPSSKFFQRILEEFNDHLIAKDVDPEVMETFDWTKMQMGFVRT